MVRIFKYDSLVSTNKFALENITDYEDCCVIRAEIQTLGRGRFSRKWISDKKNNCYISFILKPDINYKEHFQNLTQYLSVVACDELKKYDVTPNIKWPNDVQINGKKIAGILCETSFSENKLKGIVLGIGINLNLKQEDLNNIDIPATSLNLEIGSIINSDSFIENLVDNFFSNYQNFLTRGFSEIKAKYISYCNFLGKEISVKNPNPTALGIAVNITDTGVLEILTKDGKIEKILSGDISDVSNNLQS